MDDVVTSVYAALDKGKPTINMNTNQPHQATSSSTSSCSACTTTSTSTANSSMDTTNTTEQPIMTSLPLLRQVDAAAALSKDIATLNDRAVEWMLKKDFGKSLETLQLALSKAVALQQTTALQAPFLQTPAEQQHEESPIASIPLSATPFDTTADGIFVLFHRAMIIPHDHHHHHCHNESTQQKSQSRALATLLYNVGLVYHLQALHIPHCHQATEQLFAHALQYYYHAYYIIETSSHHYGFQDVLLLLLALFNNMGHIHAGVYVNAEKTRQCMRWMQSTFASKNTKRVLFPADYQFFFQYISVVAARQLRLAPAA